MGIIIRYANEDDARSLGIVYSQSYQVAFKGIIPDKILNDVFSPEKRTEGLQREISEGIPANAILFNDDKPAGILTYGRSKDVDLDDTFLEILRIYILPTYWGQNIGTELINWGINEIQNKGCKKITLWVLEENSRARKFYEKMGFIHDGITRVIDVGKELIDLRYIKNL